eukprot:101892-Prorocentrum_minimum.AAC.5
MPLSTFWNTLVEYRRVPRHTYMAVPAQWRVGGMRIIPYDVCKMKATNQVMRITIRLCSTLVRSALEINQIESAVGPAYKGLSLTGLHFADALDRMLDKYSDAVPVEDAPAKEDKKKKKSRRRKRGKKSKEVKTLAEMSKQQKHQLLAWHSTGKKRAKYEASVAASKDGPVKKEEEEEEEEEEGSDEEEEEEDDDEDDEEEESDDEESDDEDEESDDEDDDDEDDDDEDDDEEEDDDIEEGAK